LPAIEQFLGSAGFDRAPWLVVAFAAGIVAWFAMPTAWDWTALVMLCLALSLAAVVLLKADGPHPHLRLAAIVLPLLLAGGCLTIWTKSTLIGAVPIAKPVVATIDARVLAR
jgi:competence protein ComEC